MINVILLSIRYSHGRRRSSHRRAFKLWNPNQMHVLPPFPLGENWTINHEQEQSNPRKKKERQSYIIDRAIRYNR